MLQHKEKQENASDRPTLGTYIGLLNHVCSSIHVPYALTTLVLEVYTMRLTLLVTVLPWTAAAAALSSTRHKANNIVNQTTCGGTTYAYTGLEGYGYIPSNEVDKYGDTLGGIGSSIAIEQGSWHQTSHDSYSGIVYVLPDRGWYVRPPHPTAKPIP
jgi:hypothetical protein